MNASKGPAGGQPPAPTDERHAITRAARLLGSLTLLSRLTGLARDVVIGAIFGASSSADAFFVAFRIPNLFRRVVAEGASSSAFVPVFTSELVRRGRAAAARASTAVGGIAFVFLLILVVVGVIFSDQVVTVFAPGFTTDPAKRALTVSLTRLTFPYLLFVGLAAWAMGTLHTFRRFTAPAFGPVLLNLSIVVAAVVLATRLETPIYALVVGVLVGGVLQFAVQVPSLRKQGIGHRAATVEEAEHARRAVGKVGKLLGPTLLGGAVYQVNIVVATIFASLLPARSVAYLWYAGRVFEFPLGIVAVAIGTAALPSLSDQASSGRFAEMAESLIYALRLVWSLCLPATVGLWMLAPAIVSLLYHRGEFTTTDVAMTAWALRAYAVGMLGVASIRVLTSAFYALKRPRVPVFAAIVALLVNAVADLALMGPTDPTAPWWGASIVAHLGDALRITDLRHAGLALGTGVAATANALLLFGFARMRLRMLRLRTLARSFALHGGATAAMAAALAVWRWTVDAYLGGSHYAMHAQALGGVVLGTGIYVAVALAAGSEEVRRLFSTLDRG